VNESFITDYRIDHRVVNGAIRPFDVEYFWMKSARSRSTVTAICSASLSHGGRQREARFARIEQQTSAETSESAQRGEQPP
jgi:hypothetical protein